MRAMLERAQQAAQPGGTTARGRARHQPDRANPRRRDSSHSTGIAGSVSCQNTTIIGGPETNSARLGSPATRQRKARATPWI